jgi:hypothetical protein
MRRSHRHHRFAGWPRHRRPGCSQTQDGPRAPHATETDEDVARALDLLVDVQAGSTGDWLEVIRLAAVDAWYRPATDVEAVLPQTEPEPKRAGRDGSGKARTGTQAPVSTVEEQGWGTRPIRFFPRQRRIDLRQESGWGTRPL